MSRIRVFSVLGLVLVGCLPLLIGSAAAQAKASPGTASQDAGGQKKLPPLYIGAKSCKKCHMKSSIGKQYKIWQGKKHAKAFELLKSERAQEVAKEQGLEVKAFEAPECLKCHTTGHGYGPRKTHYGPKFNLEEGVTCEACHGPGEFFKKPEDGKLHKEAEGKGYLQATEALCRGCHNEESPTWNPEADTTEDDQKVGFDFKTRLKMMAHPIPKEGEADR